MSTAKKKPTTCAPKTAVAYARYSSAGQRDVSIDQQLQDIRAFADREGYTIVYEYADRAKSGYKRSDRRTEFQNMLRAAGSGSFDTVIAWKVDRFGRNRRESAEFKGQLADNGVSVVYAMEPIPDGAAGCLTEGMLEAIAEWYSRNLSENVKRGKNDNALKCIANYKAVFGYDIGPDRHYVVNEEEAAVVRQIFSLYSQGTKITDISRILYSQGIVSKTGEPYIYTRIRYTLTNEAYIGVYKYADFRIPGGMPTIIDMDTWNTCQRILETTHRANGPTADYLLSGKCRCGFCNSLMIGNFGTGNAGKRYYYYTCQRQRRHHGCQQKYLKKDDFEDQIVDFLFDNVLEGRSLSRFASLAADALKASMDESPVMKLEKEYHDITRKIENINKAISEGIWAESTMAMLKGMTEKAKDLETKIAYQKVTDQQLLSEDRILFYLQKIANGKRDDREFLHSLVFTLINSVTVYDGWARVVVNASDHVGTIPPDDLPPLDSIKEFPKFDHSTNAPGDLTTVEPYPVIIFKIPLKTA